MAYTLSKYILNNVIIVIKIRLCRDIKIGSLLIDYRSRVKIYINKDIKTIKDIENKLVSLFEIDQFHLTSGSDYLPSSEDVRILEPNEVLNAIPAESPPVSEKISSKKTKKRKSQRFDENSSEPINFHNYSVKKRKKKNSSYAEDFMNMDTIENPTYNSNDTTVTSKKKKKSKILNSENQNENVSTSKKNITNTKLLQNVTESKNVSQDGSLLNAYIPKRCMIFDNSTDVNKKQNSSNSTKSEMKNNHLNGENGYKCKGDLPSYVKKNPVPTITHEYLNEKKTNIVKIDIVNKTTPQVSEQISESQNKSIEHFKIKSIENPLKIIIENNEGTKISNLEIPTLPESSVSNISNLDNKNKETPKDNEIKSISGDNQQDITKITPETDKDNKLSNPKRKFFFFNSTILTPNATNVETKQESYNQITQNQMYRQKYFTMTSPYISPRIITYKNLNVENEKCERIESTPAKNEDYQKANKNEVDIIKDSSCDISSGMSSTSDDSSIHNSTAATPDKNEVDRETKENEVDIIKDISCDISGLISVNDDSSIHKSISAISGLQDLPSSTSSFVRPKQIAGIGHTLDVLKTQHSSPYSTLEESECSEFITKRKRKRVRKRKNPKPQADIAAETPVSASSNYSDISLNTKACPSLHVKFEYENEDDNIKVVNLKEEILSKNNINTINLSSDRETSIIKESTILKAPLMKDILPKTGDLIAFKIFRMTENYTPELSSFITGKVVKFEENIIVFDIIAGFDQCREPSGKFSIETDGTKNGKNVPTSTQICFNWDNLMCPRLLYP